MSSIWPTALSNIRKESVGPCGYECPFHLACRAVSVMQKAPVGAVARQFGGVSASASVGSIAIRTESFSVVASGGHQGLPHLPLYQLRSKHLLRLWDAQTTSHVPRRGALRHVRSRIDSQMLTWMCRPTSVIGGKADMARNLSVCPLMTQYRHTGGADITDGPAAE